MSQYSDLLPSTAPQSLIENPNTDNLDLYGMHVHAYVKKHDQKKKKACYSEIAYKQLKKT